MKKVCAVCGKVIEDGATFHIIESGVYACGLTCWTKHFWDGILKDYKTEDVVVVDGKIYSILPDGVKQAGDLGFGGMGFIFRSLEDPGHMIISHNVWFRDIVPDEYKDVLVNNFKIERV